ncbi:saponin hydrolase precursor [Colletotrichum truncatum]|uniref:Saponin hydrolase n=1 Tax=Colletotrichum truncatum TaxID=5467 RepID=A0ACC3ZCX3_COLTU|nr:saponin hydrolase precursor [Colletotrichum truncatum]KAF6797933.1 saponin hydrolase precursor [Colletotrichum truncatum]
MARLILLLRLLLFLAPSLTLATTCNAPPPPDPEPIEVIELSLPPVSAEDAPGSCTAVINPHGTGCIAQRGGGSTPETVGIMAAGDFLPDNKHVITLVTFTGAPAAPDPRSIYQGEQIILVKTDGETFPNGDPWKCITCGIPSENRVGMSHMLDYPQSFGDGKRILAGDNVITCGEIDLTSVECNSSKTFVYPIRWETTAEGSTSEDTPGGPMRELRIHPDNVHIGFSSFYSSNGRLGQHAYFGRLVFNAAPQRGLPRAPRYDVHNVTTMFDPNAIAPITVKGNEIFINPEAITVGELRGFTGRGHEAVYVGSPREAGNTDVFSVHLQTGKIRRLTSHPEYVDPIDVSADDEWLVILDTRATNRHMFIAGMRGLPPFTDIVASFITTGVRNNGPRRFFQPWILDKYGDRGEYYGQKVNGPGNGVPGSGDIDDPEWNAMADPRWSPDGTAIAYWQAQTISPACGGENPLPCYPSTAQGGRTYRLMLAKLVSRQPLNIPPAEEASDEIAWGVPYIPGSVTADRPGLSPGEFIHNGKASGFVEVSLTKKLDPNAIDTVITVYHNYSDDGTRFINGWENVTEVRVSPTYSLMHWYADLVQTGEDSYLASKKTGPVGYHVELDITRNYIKSNGTLVTTINGVEYLPPQSGT